MKRLAGVDFFWAELLAFVVRPEILAGQSPDYPTHRQTGDEWESG